MCLIKSNQVSSHFKFLFAPTHLESLVACLTISLAWIPLNGRIVTVCDPTRMRRTQPRPSGPISFDSASLETCSCTQLLLSQYYHFYTENSELVGRNARQFKKTTAAAQHHCPVCTSTDRASIPFHSCDNEKIIAPPLFISPSLREKLVLLACTVHVDRAASYKVGCVFRPVMITICDVTRPIIETTTDWPGQSLATDAKVKGGL